MLRVGKSVRRASAKRRSRNEPSGSGVNLLKSGMITAGAISSKSNWNVITTPAAQIHQIGPVHSISFNNSASDGNPSIATSKNPFTRSRTDVLAVVVLKPNRSSSLNWAYHAKCGRHFVRMRTHITFVGAAEQQFCNRARENQN